MVSGTGLSKHFEFRKIILEVDSKLVVDWLQVRTGQPNVQLNLIHTCLELLNKDWDLRFCHVYREGKKVADSLAKQALQLPRGLHYIVLLSTLLLCWKVTCGVFRGLDW